MSRDTTGVALIGQILARIARDEPCTASGLADDLGAARATTFAVLRDLEQARLVERDAKGLVTPGETAARLGFAAFGLAPLVGPAQALLPALRDGTDGAVELVVRGSGQDLVLMRRCPAGWPSAETIDGTTSLASPIGGPKIPVTLRLRLRAPITEAEQSAARQSLAAVAAALSRALQPDRNDENA